MQATASAFPRSAARVGLNRVEWACVAFALVVGHTFLLHEWLYPSAWDATSYVDIGKDIAERGLIRKFHGSDFRTYGYPFVVSFVLRAAGATGLSFVVLLFELQLLAYGAAAYFLRSVLAPVSLTVARIVFCGLLVNFYVLIYTPESLTESVSLTLLVLAAGFWVMLWRRGFALWGLAAWGAAIWPLIAGSLAIGFALMVRPANLFMVAVWLFGVAIVAWRQRPPALGAAIYAAIMLAFLALPMAPQIRNNVVHYAKWSPLVAVDLGLLQQSLGAQNLKYATGLPPVATAPIYYNNPLFPGTAMDERAPLTWYLDYPLRGAATVALHTFNLTDQDLLFTYSRDLNPWYRVPLGIVNHAMVALGLVGLVLVGHRVRSSREPRWRDAYIVLLALMVTNWAVYVWTAVEMRFGSVLLLVLFPLAIYAAIRVAAMKSLRLRGGVVCGIAAYVIFALLLSDWVRDQSQQIRDHRDERTDAAGSRVAGGACCARATDAAPREGASAGAHSHRPGFAG